MNSFRAVDSFRVLADLFVQKLHIYLLLVVAFFYLILEGCCSGHGSRIFLAKMGALFSPNLRALAFNNTVVHIRRISNVLVGATEAHPMISGREHLKKVTLPLIYLVIK